MKQDKIDHAIRDWLQLSDDQFAFYLRHREQIIEALQQRKLNAESDSKVQDLLQQISDDLDRKKDKKTKDKHQLLELNIHLTFMQNPDGIEPMEPKDIAKMSGKSTRSITGTIEASIQKLKDSKIFSVDGELGDWFNKVDGQWLS